MGRTVGGARRRVKSSERHPGGEAGPHSPPGVGHGVGAEVEAGADGVFEFLETPLHVEGQAEEDGEAAGEADSEGEAGDVEQRGRL